jgi:dynein intermediate chain 1
LAGNQFKIIQNIEIFKVYWNPDTSKNYNFYSISSDGRVMNWILMKNKLEPEEVIKLKLTGSKNL